MTILLSACANAAHGVKDQRIEDMCRALALLTYDIEEHENPTYETFHAKTFAKYENVWDIGKGLLVVMHDAQRKITGDSFSKCEKALRAKIFEKKDALEKRLAKLPPFETQRFLLSEFRKHEPLYDYLGTLTRKTVKRGSDANKTD